PPDKGLFKDLMESLRASLKHELHLRALWYVSPRQVGVFGWETWRDAGALEELAAECYVYVFVDRLRRLEAQLLVKPNVDGLVALAIGQFIYERRKHYDPLGF